MDILNNNIVATVVGGLIAIVTSVITAHLQRKYAERKEIRDNFKHKAELLASNGFNTPREKLYDAQNIDVLFCSYQINIGKSGVISIKYPKSICNPKSLKRHSIYLENIGDSDINELEIAVENPKNNALLEKDSIEEYAAKGRVKYGVLLDRKIRKGEVLIVTIYYCEEDPIVSLFSASLLLFYRDSLGNVCEQPVFPEQCKTYEPTLITQKEWREHVNVSKTLTELTKH